MTIYDIPDKQRVRDLLFNWRNWAKDCPLDPAQIFYYTVSPMFRDVMPQASTPAYDSDSALMVEEVLRVMRYPYPQERWLLAEYFGKGRPQTEIARELRINQSSVSKYRLPAAERIFAEQWAEMVRK